jgi:hypothetical protein
VALDDRADPPTIDAMQQGGRMTDNADGPRQLPCDVNEWFGQGPGYGTDPDVLPYGWSLGMVSGVTSLPGGEVIICHRGRHADPVIVYDREGNYRRSWGREVVGEAHGLRAAPDGSIWLTDTGTHQVHRFSPTGELLISIGERGRPGCDNRHFDMPTDIAFGSDAIYVSDGYGNARVVKLRLDGAYHSSWGTRGHDPGEFDTPHSLAATADGRIYVSDRANGRIQIFDADGRFLEAWGHVGHTNGITITPADEVWIVTAFVARDGDVARPVGYRVMRLEPGTGRILEQFECVGHMVERTAWGDVFVAALSGNVMQMPLSGMPATDGR